MSKLGSRIGTGRLVVVYALAAAFAATLTTGVAHADTTPSSPNAAPTLGRPAINANDETAIRPFQFRASDEALADLRRRFAATKWPGRETVPDASQGVQLATMQKLAAYWATDYDWRSRPG